MTFNDQFQLKVKKYQINLNAFNRKKTLKKSQVTYVHHLFEIFVDLIQSFTRSLKNLDS